LHLGDVDFERGKLATHDGDATPEGDIDALGQVPLAVHLVRVCQAEEDGEVENIGSIQLLAGLEEQASVFLNLLLRPKIC